MIDLEHIYLEAVANAINMASNMFLAKINTLRRVNMKRSNGNTIKPK